MTKHLHPDGVLIVEPWILPDAWIEGVSLVDVVEEDGRKLVRVITSRRADAMTILRMHYAVAAHGEITSVDERHELGLFTKEEYLQAFARAGLDATWDPDGLTGRGLLVGARSKDDSPQRLWNALLACDLTRWGRLAAQVACRCSVRSGCAAMLTPTSPIAQLQTFRAQLHAGFFRRADALFELGDALLWAQAVPSLPHLSLEPIHQRGWAAPTPPWRAGRSTPSSCGICWCASCRPPTRWCSPLM
jgi:hypothetical protein